jgi:hypothetical protein
MHIRRLNTIRFDIQATSKMTNNISVFQCVFPRNATYFQARSSEKSLHYSDVTETVKIDPDDRLEVDINTSSLVVVARVSESDEFPPVPVPKLCMPSRHREPAIIAARIVRDKAFHGVIGPVVNSSLNKSFLVKEIACCQATLPQA